MSFDVNELVKEPRHRKNNSLSLLLCMPGAQKLYGQLDVGNATYSFDGLRADAKAAHLRKGVIGAKRVRHGGGDGGDALVVHPVKEEDEITANDDNGGGGGDDGMMFETAADAALIQRRRRRRRQKADDRGEGRHLRCKLESAG